MMPVRLLLVAKAPVSGRAKTRLGDQLGMDIAAELAAAALLDTIEVGAAAFPGTCHLALEGDLAAAARGGRIGTALTGWQVFAQQGRDLADRLVHAHRSLAERADGPVVQIGMDTPQITPALLRSVSARLDARADAVLGPAEDGGWWALALTDPRRAAALRDVPMSRPDTFLMTHSALERNAATVATAETLRDVDTVADAVAVAAAAPGTRFAQTWRRAVSGPDAAS